ncbi:PREDICTED: SAP30-binding protein-like, partial [Priapulus caudatus]|uniref:SAP30-binding protein-like n=1 Tax=Priapulus caudatus TaxID=37621 RepID=A0ABM1F514_PRICU
SDDYDDDDCPIPLSHVSAPHRSDTSSPGDVDFSSSLSRAVRHTPLADVRLPASPEGRCSKILEEKIAELHRKKSRDASAADLNRLIQQRKDIRNPSIYEKLIDFCKIDEYGSNFPPDVYDPRGWPDAAYYEELAREQKAEMDRRERERRNDRTKVEFVTGVKKAAAPGELTGDDPLKKRKSKWDQTAAQTLPGVAVTTTASAVHKTLIPGVGLLSKKK